jgi:hypothetical protein
MYQKTGTAKDWMPYMRVHYSAQVLYTGTRSRVTSSQERYMEGSSKVASEVLNQCGTRGRIV